MKYMFFPLAFECGQGYSQAGSIQPGCNEEESFLSGRKLFFHYSPDRKKIFPGHFFCRRISQ
jgi:hypothetical protein